MIRTFVAVELGDDLRRSLIALQERLKRDLRSGRVEWTRPEALHVTLKFLGDIEEAQVAPIHEALTAAFTGQARFTVEVDGIGTFPTARDPRIIWAGLKASGPEHPLLSLSSAVERALLPLGFPAEDRPFHPHVTLGRVKDGGRAVAEALRSSGGYATTSGTGRIGSLTVEQVALMRSELRPTGSVYTRLRAVSLTGNT
jgi:2'-5' RNA ligase